MTYARNTVYGTEVSMWADVVAKRPDNLRARNDLAVALSEAGRVGEAMEAYRSILERIPESERKRLSAGERPRGRTVSKYSYRYHFARAQANMGQLLARMGRRDEAIGHYVLSLRAVPGLREVHGMLRGALLAEPGIDEENVDAEIERRLRLF